MKRPLAGESATRFSTQRMNAPPIQEIFSLKE
jgi:hypothetical protein